MTTFNTWKRFFQEQDGAAGNKAFASLLNLVREGTDSEKAGKLRTEAETVWLARHPEGSVVFVHHLTVMGGSRTQPNLSVFALVGGPAVPGPPPPPPPRRTGRGPAPGRAGGRLVASVGSVRERVATGPRCGGGSWRRRTNRGCGGCSRGRGGGARALGSRAGRGCSSSHGDSTPRRLSYIA
jgi:hypothetical protein